MIWGLFFIFKIKDLNKRSSYLEIRFYIFYLDLEVNIKGVIFRVIWNDINNVNFSLVGILSWSWIVKISEGFFYFLDRCLDWWGIMGSMVIEIFELFFYIFLVRFGNLYLYR